MAKKVVLLQPKTGGWDLAGTRPPDSLLAVAAEPYHAGYAIQIIDQRIDRHWKTTLKDALKEALLFGTTSMTGPQIRYALEASKFVKENSDVPVVWGGVHASLLPEQTLQSKYIDIVVKGEGDYALYEIIQALENNEGLDGIKGLYFKKDGKIKHTGERPLIRDLDNLKNLPYELVDLDNYYGFDIGKGKSITLMTSRGCPYRCAFCYNTVYNKNRWRGMSAERTLELIQRVVFDFGVKSIYFQDDNFCANVQRFEKIVHGIIKEKIEFSWGLLGARVNTLADISDTLMANTVKAGCMNIDVGVESGADRILELVSKDVNVSEVIKLNKRLSKYFDKTKYTFIMGVPSETEAELLQTVQLATRLCTDNSQVLPLFFIYCAYPGTQLHDLAVEYGFKVPQSLEEWSAINYETAYLHYPWLDNRRIRMMQNFEFSSMFASKNNEYKMRSHWHKMIARIYRPIAKARFEHNIYHLPVERLTARLLARVLV